MKDVDDPNQFYEPQIAIHIKIYAIPRQEENISDQNHMTTPHFIPLTPPNILETIKLIQPTLWPH